MTATGVQAFTEHYQRVVLPRMQDLPICHHRLSVAAGGFTPFDDGQLGYLITPWHIALVWLPARPDLLQGLRTGQTVTLSCPGGASPFLASELDSPHAHLSLSLFSPVFEFTDMEAAVAAANAALDSLLGHEQPAPAETSTAAPLSRRDFLRGLTTRASR